MLPRVTLIGRPNVGKSSIFNALSKHKIAIISDTENTTRDILEYHVDDIQEEVSYILCDSGGIVEAKDEELLTDVRQLTQKAIESSDVILLVVEYNRMTQWDETIIQMLRKSGKQVIVVANKADNRKRDIEAYENFEVGLGPVIPVSAVQNRGFRILKDEIAKILKKEGYGFQESDVKGDILKIALIGRPNVGKSSLINAISGKGVSLVQDESGTTRDAIDTIIEFEGEKICMIDTAGIRRSGKIGKANIESWSVIRSERAIARADVVAIVIDAFEGVTHQDEHLVGEAIKAQKGIILVFNKWDKVLAKPDIDGDTILNRYMQYLSNKFDFISYAPVVFSSAINGKRIDLILQHAQKIKKERNKRVKTGIFNKFLEQIVYEHAPTGNKKSHKPKVFYGSQVEVNPPRFVISVNNADHFHFSYKRYIENQIREVFGFEGTPIDIELKSRKSMFKSKEKGGSMEDHFGA
ncbi:ribosome biogenesis GTPase Der [Candidatus Gracilibacteria bacterium]|nr:MAG: ribosome biogenesis GTPase Der [Candidatus Gracilibacteria bacterium]